MRLLVSAIWKDNHAQLKYYDTNKDSVIVIHDKEYKNWWLSDKGENKKVLYNALEDKKQVYYVHSGGMPNEEGNNWEHKLRKHHNYLLTKQLMCGALYDENGKLVKNELNEVQQKALGTMLRNARGLEEKYLRYLQQYSSILSQPIPDFKRVAVDIEVWVNKGFPNMELAENVVTCIGFADNRGYKATYTLAALHKKGKEKYDYITYFETEKELLQAAMLKLRNYPMIITFNGDAFDLAYLYMRCKKLSVVTPIEFNEKDIHKNVLTRDAVVLERGIHLDLFRIFYNRSLQNYAFNARYKQFGLDDVAQAMIGEGKLKYDVPLTELTQEELSKYCLNDAELTLKLTTYSNNLLIKLLVLISRITKTSIEDIGRFGISNWIKQMLYFEHRKTKTLIPNRDELLVKGQASTAALIKGKKYQGAFVMEALQGAFFNVAVVDFASLYPSIIKRYNISYETINCGHRECLKNKIPETNHYTCTKKMGMLALLVGVFRDLRVEYFKKLSKSGDEKDLYDAVSQAIKVILNGTYGVMGTESFGLYCVPIAESITAQGRFILQETKDYVEKEFGLKVIYGDTDSLFIHNPTPDQLQSIIKRTNKQYGIDLEVDKHYNYIIFAKRKKNYLGVKNDGKLDVKGLVGKKSHIPKLIKNAFEQITFVLQKVHNPQELNEAKETIGNIIRTCNNNMSEYKFPIGDYAFRAMINKKLQHYGVEVEQSNNTLDQTIPRTVKKGVPIHVKVAQEMYDEGEVIEEKMAIPFIKCRDGSGKPLSKASYVDIDINKYRETLESVVEPLLDVLDMQFGTLALHKQRSLDDLFG